MIPLSCVSLSTNCVTVLSEHEALNFSY